MHRDGRPDVARIVSCRRHGTGVTQSRRKARLGLARDASIAQREPASKGSPDTIAPDGRRSARAAGRIRKVKMPVLALLATLALAGLGSYGYRWLTFGRFVVSTDDAYVRAHTTMLAAKVPGYLVSIEVEDNALVHAGDVIARIDDGDFRLAVKSARDKVATQEATIGRLERQILAQAANVEQAKAQRASMQAARRQAEAEFERQQSLAAKDFASSQMLERALANRDQAVAAVEGARASLDAAHANVDVLKAQQQEALRALDELKTALARTERDLSFTLVRAPIDGVIGNRAGQTGNYVQPGQRLASLVPLDEVFIDANFKETQLARLRPGQQVDLSIDALPGDTVHGVIESISPASGSEFSLLPPENATGNFRKIVQRLPVRIKVPVDLAKRQVLRPGMSVVVSVNTKPQGVVTASAAPPFVVGAASIPRTGMP